MGCGVTDLDPLGYTGHTGWIEARLRLAPWLWLDLSGGAEWRTHDGHLRTILAPSGGTAFEEGLRQRSDQRWFTGEAAAFRITPWLSLLLRHDWLSSQSTLEPVAGHATCQGSQPACSPVGTAERWQKHILTLGTSMAW
jgi:hypothetical protein